MTELIDTATGEILHHNDRPRYWAERINASWQKSVEGILETSGLVQNALLEVTQDELAPHLNFSRQTISHLARIANRRERFANTLSLLPPSWGTLYELAKLDDDAWEEATAGGLVHADMERRDARKLRAPNHEKSPAPVIPGQYRTIVIDPPWDMTKMARDVRPNQIGFDYPTLSVDQLSGMVLPAADECHLYCWTTQKYLPETFGLLSAWGFSYLVTMVWHKPGGFQPAGLPQYNCEFVLLGRRGGQGFEDTKAFPVCFSAPRREHSRKPDEFYDLVRRVSPAPRIDIFSRELRKEFEQFGNETRKYG